MLPKTTDREMLKEALEILERCGCFFWSCEGPDKPDVDMKTCFACSFVRKLRKHLKEE